MVVTRIKAKNRLAQTTAQLDANIKSIQTIRWKPIESFLPKSDSLEVNNVSGFGSKLKSEQSQLYLDTFTDECSFLMHFDFVKITQKERL